MAATQGSRISLILALAFPAIVAAALALAYYGYRYADAFLRSSEALLMEENRQVAEDLQQQIESRIDEADITLLRSIELEYAPDTGAAVVPPLESTPPVIGSYVVLDSKRAIVGGRKAAGSWPQLLQELNLAWGSLSVGSFRHVHKTVLVAYGRKRTTSGRDYYVAAQIDLGLIRRDWLPEEVAKLRGNRRIVVLDEQRAAVHGQAWSQPDDRFLYEASFGKTLYGWRIQLAPRNVEELQGQLRARQALGRVLIALSTVIIAVGLAVVWLAVRAESRASRLKSEFIANVSHELKTPLSLIRMFGELLATGKHKGEGTARDYAQIITRESERLSHLIDNVLDFARLERGKASYDFAEGNLAEVVERALDVCRYRLEKEKMKMRTEIEAELPRVRMDENAITLLLLNLVDNAIKYGGEGGEVEVLLNRSPGGLALAVRDRGPGIAADEHRRIFERFYRARHARDRNVRGSGIGLALVKHIAEAHGGRVEVESEPGRGATFRVFVPAAPVVVETPPPEPVAADQGAAPVPRAMPR